MLGLPCEEWSRSQHMLTTPPRGYTIITAAADGYSSSSSHPANKFSKDGREISVGDCALFKPPQDCPPFIGIIRLLSVDKDNKLNLGVNWLYRPAEVKLGKGVLPEATPNELFYSFHKDEIPAASLLHPCRVSFLPKGIELPYGTSSFVCRRVYDTTNKCLWWLTDQDYINEHQEEVNQLLHKTQVEINAGTQSSGQSPKAMDSTSSASPFKTGSDSVHSNTPNIHSQVKSKKRECSVKIDDTDSSPHRKGSISKVEMEKIMDKGGLIDSEGVEKLMQLMVPYKSEMLDLAGRSILAGFIAETEAYDCLSQFVQLKGLLIFDEWLQEVLKGKIGDLSGPNDKSVEEFLLILLRALDKLPVNLQALQKCNIGKSVNRLRSHKNLEIQKKARGLVETWKKRVEAEMNINETKSGLNQGDSWPAQPLLLQVSEGRIKQSGGSSEVAIKSSISQLSSFKPVSRQAYTSAGSLKLLPPPTSADANARGWQPHRVDLAGASDIPIATEGVEKVSGSSQSHCTSQSCPGEETKSGRILEKEDIRGSTSVLINVNKTSHGLLCHRKSSNGEYALHSSGLLKDTRSTRNSSLNKNTTSDKLSQSGVVALKLTEGISVEGNNNKLIVKIPNHSRNLAQDASCGSPDDPSLINCRTSSAVLAERHKLSDPSLINFKSVQTGTDENRSLAVGSDDSENFVDKRRDVISFSSMNAFIESCVKYSEVDATLSAVDDAGMNLLASVAAGEISKSCLATPIRSPESINAIVEESGVGGNTEAKSPNDSGQDNNHPGGSDENKHSKSNEVCPDFAATNVDGNFAALVSEEKSDWEIDKHCNNPKQELQQTKENCLGREETVVEILPDSSIPVLPGATKDEVICRENDEQLCEAYVSGKIDEGDTNGKPLIACPTIKLEMNPTLNTNIEVEVKEKKLYIDRLTSVSQAEETVTELKVQSEQGGDKLVPFNSCYGMGKIRDNDAQKAEQSDQYDFKTSVSDSKCQKPKHGENTVVTNIRALGTRASEISDQDAEDIGDNVANNKDDGQQDGQILHSNSPVNESKESEKLADLKESKLTAMEGEEAEEWSATAGASSRSAAGISDGDAKVEFDLNEGLNADGGKCLVLNGTATPGCSNSDQLISPEPFPATGVYNGVSTSLTVAVAAKGPVLPFQDLLENKEELGWKGSAATSAFHPAEPREVMEMSLRLSSMPHFDARPGKQSCPLLDIDLNVADERIPEDVCSHSLIQKDDCVSLPKVVHNHKPADDKVSTSRPGWCSGRIDLNLNQADETPELGNCFTSSSHRIVEAVMQSKPSFYAPGSSLMNVHRDFALNNGPTTDEINVASLVNNKQARISVQSQQPIPGYRMSNLELGNLSTWFPSTGNTYSAVSLSSIMPDRGGQPFPVGAACVPQRVSGLSCSGNPFGADIYSGPILSSSPAVPFPSGTFQYPVLHVGSTFPLPLTSLSGAPTNVDPSSDGRRSFPAANSLLSGTAATVLSHCPRSYVVCIPDGTDGNGPESSRKWVGQGLDLNAGPGVADGKGEIDSVPLALRQLSVGSSQSLAEEQARMFSMSGSILKRKEPEGGWDGFKQSSWQ